MNARLPKIVRLWRCSPKQHEKLLSRSELDVASVLPRVKKIVEDVRKRGDIALVEYSKRFDRVKLSREQLRVFEDEMIEAAIIDPGVMKAIARMAKNIISFHRKQLPKEWMVELQPGVKAGQLVRPLESVGIYIPGGLARYPSSLLMTVIPARIAGVKRIIVCTPPNRDGKVDPTILFIADVMRVDDVFKVGGAQAIAAMAFGTQTIPKVEKIVGPGGIYVAAAKLLVSTEVGIDFVAGPSEVLIVADDSADPECVAMELIAQAEHDPNAAAVLVTTSEKLASKVRERVGPILHGNPRAKIVLESFHKYGRIVITSNLNEAVKFANEYAPEHLRLLARNPKKLLKRVTNVGSVFVGPWTPVAAGDFAVGPSHILPTGGAASRRAGLSVLDFVKLPSVQVLTERGLRGIAGVVEKLAEVEGLPAHARSVRERLER